MFELLTDKTEAVVLHALDEAVTTNATEIEPAHMLLSIVDHGDGIAQEVLAGEGLTRQSVTGALALLEPSKRVPGEFHNRIKAGAMQYSSESQQALQAAEEQAMELQGTRITTDHLLLGLLATDEVQRLLGSMNIDDKAVSRTVLEKLRDAG